MKVEAKNQIMLKYFVGVELSYTLMNLWNETAVFKQWEIVRCLFSYEISFPYSLKQKSEQNDYFLTISVFLDGAFWK